MCLKNQITDEHCEARCKNLGEDFGNKVNEANLLVITYSGHTIYLREEADEGTVEHGIVAPDYKCDGRRP
jgi:hypothetical protein